MQVFVEWAMLSRSSRRKVALENIEVQCGLDYTSAGAPPLGIMKASAYLHNTPTSIIRPKLS